MNNAKKFGDEKSPFGGIGRNGVLDTPEAVKADLNEPGTAYLFFGERPSMLQLAGVALGVVSIAMIAWPSGGGA